MKILIDECLPRRLKRSLPGHQVMTVVERGWAGTKNGALLARMEREFDVFITVDQNMQYQHDLETIAIAFVVLRAVSNKIESLVPLMPRVLEALNTIQPGDVVEISDR
jgi:predicted nuclease of predicted toxin-antitoxin system